MPGPNDNAEAVAAPIGEMIAAIGRGVADAQQAMDNYALEQTKAILSSGDAIADELRRVGYRPTWYRIPQVDAELHVNLSIASVSAVAVGGGAGGTGESQTTVQRAPGLQLLAAPSQSSQSMQATQFTASSKVSFRIVAVPPSPGAEEIKVAPNLVGKNLSEVRAMLSGLGIPYRVEFTPIPKDKLPPGQLAKTQPADTDIPKSSSPARGTLLAPGEPILLKF